MEGVSPVEQAEVDRAELVANINRLIEPQKEGEEPEVRDVNLRNLGKRALLSHNQSPRAIGLLLDEGDRRVYPEDKLADIDLSDQWAKLGRVLDSWATKRKAYEEGFARSGAGVAAGAREGYESMAPSAPIYVVAAFREGRHGRYERVWSKEVEFLSIRNEQDRTRWAFLNMGYFNGRSNAGAGWKGYLDHWLDEDLGDAARLAKLNVAELRVVDETKSEIIAMMAVSSAARAMEHSGGIADKYAKMITQVPEGAPKPDLDKQDDWAEFLLAKDPKKYHRLITMPLVDEYYKRVLADAGIKVVVECGEGRAKVSEFTPKTTYDDVEKNSKLVEFLKFKGPGDYKGGFDAYIRDVLLEGQDADEVHKAAAKLACDAFLVEKYTRWEFEMKAPYRLMPFVGWGGDPFRATIEPAFLPRQIKKVYQEGDEAILKMFDDAFRPGDMFNGDLTKDAVRPTAVEHLKNFSRLNAAIYAVLGSSTGSGIPNWSDKTQEELGSVADLLYQVYGTIGKPARNTGKQIVGAMMARILECKALALAIESGRPGFKSHLRTLFFGGDPRQQEVVRPFYKVQQFLWGPELDNRRGFVESLAGGRTRLVFRGNRYNAEASLGQAWDILSSNDQDPGGRGRALALNRIGFVLDAIQAIVGGRGGRR